VIYLIFFLFLSFHSFGGVERVTVEWDGAIQGLAMTRSMCDGVAKTGGVVSTPDISAARLCASHRVLVLASDGVRLGHRVV